jgi:hypothetical protein
MASAKTKRAETLKRRLMHAWAAMHDGRARARPRASAAPGWHDIQKKILRIASDPPLALLSGLLVVAFVTVLARARLYGISVDEPLQQRYGEHVLAWYLTLGKDTSFLTAFSPADHMPQHGGIFDAGIAALQRLFAGADPWLVRHIVTGLCGWLGLVAIALCGFELGGAWVAFVAALGLWLYPRYYGAIYNNPKDVPAAVALTFVLWATLLLVRRWERTPPPLGTAILLGCCIGVAVAIRVNAVTWYAVLAVLAAGWWVANGQRVWRERRLGAELQRQGMTAGAIVISSLAALIALWPYVALNPVANLLDSIQVLRAYPWNGLVLYRGFEYHAAQLPVDYVPAWLVIGSPPALVALALAGMGIAAAGALRTRGLDPRVGATVLAFALSLLFLLALHPVLYDTLRQFLYIVPPMILLAAWGLVRAVGFLAGSAQVWMRWAALALLVATIAGYAQVAAALAALSPFEYTYFSPLVGGLPGAAGKYDTDYWATCSKAAAEWLATHYRGYTRAAAPSVEGPVVEGTPMYSLIAPFLPTTLREDDAHPDFVIAFTRDRNDQINPTYHVIHTVAAEGVTLCVVKANPATSGA